ncbi:MAG: hypothetical protein ABIB93_07240 [Chloroflexota bacterium]
MENSGENKGNEMEEQEGGAIEAEVRIRKLEGLLAEKERALAEVKASLTEMKENQAALDGALTELRGENTALAEKLNVTDASLKNAVANYRVLLVKANPGVFGELVCGDSVASVNDSMERAKALVSRVRQELETEAIASRVPSGAPARTLPNLSSLSPREKISYAIGRNASS